MEKLYPCQRYLKKHDNLEAWQRGIWGSELGTFHTNLHEGPRFEVNPKYFLSVFFQAVPGGLAWRVKTWLRICEVLENENILKLFWSCEVLEHNLLILCSCCSTWCTCRKYNLVQNIILSNLNQTLYRLARTQIMINTQLSNPSIDIWIKWHLISCSFIHVGKGKGKGKGQNIGSIPERKHSFFLGGVP